MGDEANTGEWNPLADRLERLCEDIEKLLDICDNVGGRSFCALADGAVACVTSAVRPFRDEFELGFTTPAWAAFPHERSSLFGTLAAAAASSEGGHA